ncbi:MAG: MFS transporter [Chloroflexia bacterium]|nr:MFS transporter [Chloroflexia bacterium]
MARSPWGSPITGKHAAGADHSAGSVPLPEASAAEIALRPDSGQDAVGTTIRQPGKPPIDWRRNLYALFLAQLLAIVAFSLRAPFLPFFLGDLGLETTEEQAVWSGLINAFGAGTMAITAPIWGIVADRYGRKPMLMRAQFAAFVTIGLMGLATEPWHLLGLRMIEGMFTGTVTAATALVAVSMPKERLGFGLGLITTAVFSGSALGPLAGGLLADGVGYRATFGVASAMMLSGGLVTLVLVRERFVPQSKESRARDCGAGWKLLLTPVLLGLTLAMLSVRFASAAIQPIMPLFVEQLAGRLTDSSSSLAGVTLGVLGVTSAISSVYFGRLGDRKGHRMILLGCLLGSGLVYLPMALTQHPWQLIALQALFGFFAGGTIPAANALIANATSPERRGAIFGLMASAAAVGGFIGPLTGAGLAAGVGFRATFVVCGLILLATAFVLLWTERKQGRVREDGWRGP